MKKKDLEIAQMWTLNINHMGKADLDIIKDHAKHNYTNIPIAVFDTSYGYYVRVLNDPYDDVPFGTQLMEAGFSDTFAEIFCIAIKYKIVLVNFDVDGPIVKDLPVFNW